MLTVIELSDVAGKPKVKKELEGPLPIGMRIQLAFCVQRTNGGRLEVLEVRGQFRVTAVGLDTAQGVRRQVLTVDTVGSPPVWRSVKKRAEWKRVLPPAKAPRTVLE
jgi:hypothetical protein